MHRRLKEMAFVWGILWVAAGSFGGLWLLVSAGLGTSDVRGGLGLMVLIVAGVGGGGLVAFFGLRAMGSRPSRAFRLPPTWALGGGFVLALATALGLGQLDAGAGLVLPFFAASAAGLAPLAAVAWAVEGRGGGITARRGWTALGLGATAGTSMAYLLNTLLPAAVLFLIYGLASALLPLAEALLDALRFGALTRELLSPWVLVTLLEVAIVAPLVEEMVKPLALLPLVRRLDSPREAMWLGMLAGAGFAAVENLLYAALSGPAWGGVLAARTLGAALHPFGAGLTAAGWWYLLRREPDGMARWARYYGVAVGVHALWNATSVVAVTMAGAWFQGWEVDLLGITDAVVLLALLAAQGVGLLVALRGLARSQTPGVAQPQAPDERALAVWGLVCLIVLLPVGLGVLQTMW